MLPKDDRSQVIWLGGLSLLALAVIGALHAPFPFTSDQASFTIGATMMRHGAVMYVDFWDIKQPGIYLFYLLGGSLFGFTERGMHVFELIYWLVFAVVLIVTLRSRFSRGWVVAALPLLTVGTYYAVGGAGAYGQVEALAGFPLYLCLWCGLAYAESSKPRAFLLVLSGVAAAAVLLLKFLLLPIVVAFWIIALRSFRRSAMCLDGRALVRAKAFICLGVAIPLIVIVAYFSHANALRELMLTTFVSPLHIAMRGHAQDPHSLLVIFRWLALYVSPLAILSIVGAPRWIRSARNDLPLGLVSWVVLALVIGILQTRNWVPYHFVLTIVPLGILSAYGLDAVASWVHDQRRLNPRLAAIVAVLLLGALFYQPLRLLASNVYLLYKYGFARDAAEQRAFFEAVRPEYRQIREDSAFLDDPSSRPGPIFLVGGSLRYYLTGRKPATPIFGLPSFLTDRWQDETAGLKRVRPPYAYISNGYITDIESGAPEILRFIHRNYRVVRSDTLGTWYALVDR